MAAYEWRFVDCGSDVCSSDLGPQRQLEHRTGPPRPVAPADATADRGVLTAVSRRRTGRACRSHQPVSAVCRRHGLRPAARKRVVVVQGAAVSVELGGSSRHNNKNHLLTTYNIQYISTT